MRINDKQKSITDNKGVFTANFHPFSELEGKCNQMEIAEELGITLGEVNMLKKKITRT